MATAHWFGNPPDSLEPVLSQDEHSGLLVDPTQEVPPEPKTPEMRRQFYYFPPDSSDMENGVAAGEMIESPDLTPWSILLMVFCPCFLGNPFSAEKKLEYKRMMKTMCLVISVVQVILFIVAISLHGIDNPKNNWMIGPNSSTLIRMGAKNPYMMRYKAHIERFFSPIFLHSGIIHILVNLTIQLRMGLYLERRWGSIKFTCTYVGSGMVGIMMGCVLQPGTISVAASACVMGLIGAYLAQLTITWHKFDPFQLKVALFQCIFVLVVTTLEGIGPNFIDWSGHMGGAVAGVGFGYFLFGKEYALRKHIIVRRVLPVLSAIALLCFYAAGIVLFYTIITVPEPTMS